MAVLGVVFGVVLTIGSLVLPFVASAAAAGARTRAREVRELARLRGARVGALQGGILRLRTALRALAGQ